MIKAIIVSLGLTLVLVACDSDTIYPYMVEKAALSCADHEGLYSFVLNAGTDSYMVKASCVDGTHTDTKVMYQSLRNM